MLHKIISIVLSFNLILAQSGFCQGAFELNLGQYLGQMNSGLAMDKFRPLHLRYFSYDTATNNFQLLLDKGDSQDIKDEELQDKTKVLMEYFQVGLSLSNDKFWVNLRPDSEDEIIDPLLERTGLGKVMLESDLQLKKDTAAFTSPQSPEGRLYWDKLYQKARELFGSEPANIPTLTRPWIVPGEIIVKETDTSAYIYKANMKVMLEEDYLKTTNPISSGQMYTFSDPRMKELNSYSTQLIREMILPKLTKDVNTAKRYAALRQVFFSLVMARWFKERFRGKSGEYPQTIDSNNLEGLTSKEPWSKSFYFNEYKKSFENGEYNLKEQIPTISGQVIRSYVSGGQQFEKMNISGIGLNKRIVTGLMTLALLLGLTPAEGDAACRGVRCPGPSIQMEHADQSKLPSGFRGIRNNYEEVRNFVKILYNFIEWYRRQPEMNTESLVARFIKKLSPEQAKGISFDIKFAEGEGVNYYDSGIYKPIIKYGGDVIIGPGGSKSVENPTFFIRKDPEFAFGISTRDDEIYFRTLDGGITIIPRRDGSYGYTYERSPRLKNSESLKTMTYEEIDERVDEIPGFARPYLGFQLGRKNDGAPVLTITQYKDTALVMPRLSETYQFEVTDIIDFFASNGNVYVFARGDTPGTYLYLIARKDGHDLWNQDKVPPEMREIFDRRLRPGQSSPQSSSSPISGEDIEKTNVPSRTFGGIDFRQMDMLIQPMGSFSGLNFSLPVLSAATLEALDLDKELEDIRNMVKAGVMPSGERVKEYLAACFQKGKMAEKQDDLLLCLSEIYRLQEEEVMETSPELRESLVIVETGNFVLSS